MGASNGMIGYGVTIGSSLTNGSFVAIGQITDVKGPENDATSVDISHSTSPSTFHEFIAGMGDAGELDVTVLYNKTDTNTVYGYHRQMRYWQIVCPDGGNFVCQGFLKKMGTTVPIDDKIT